ADAHVVDLDQVDGVAAVLRTFLRVVVGRDAYHAHPCHLILARPAYLVRAVPDHLGEVVVVVLVADGHALRVHARELQPDRGWVGIGDHRRAAAAQPEAAVSEPGDVQWYLV